MNDRQLANFMKKVAFADDGCWLWTGAIAKDRNGYGLFHAGKTRRAHRIAYEHFIGEIPADMDLHHKCETTRCVNPHHLKPLSRQENVALMHLKPRDTCRFCHQKLPKT